MSVRVLSRRVDGAPDPLALFRALTDGGRRADVCLFETADAPERGPARSLIVFRAALSAVCRGREVEVRALGRGDGALSTVAAALPPGVLAAREARRLVARFPRAPRDADAEELLRAPSPLDVLRAMSLGLAVEPGAPRAPLAVGVLAYDLVDAFEDLPAARSDPHDFPDFAFLLAEGQVEIDHRAGRCTVSCAVFDEAREAEAAELLAATVELCGNPPSAGPRTAPKASGAAPEAEVDLDDDAYAELVRRMKRRVHAGDVFQVVPSRTFRAPCPDPLAAYAALRELNPSPYMFLVATAGRVLFGASPETAVRVARRDDGRRTVEVRPIAGTRPRGRTADGGLDRDLDDRLEAELLLDRKELAEHVMLVDLARNDVARVAVPGTRRVTELLSVERSSHVMHLVSRVTGELGPDLDALHAYRAALNAGTLVGAPKLRAAELLREHEPTRRGPYGGAVGWISPAGELDTAIVIRSALVVDGTALVRAGAGVVADSVPEREADETRRKAGAVLDALASAAAEALPQEQPEEQPEEQGVSP